MSTELLEVISAVLVPVFVLLGGAVTYGVYAEKEDHPASVRHVGWLLLVWALGAETFIGFGKDVFADLISARQKEEIKATKKELLEYVTPRRLDAEQKERIAVALAPFAPQRFRTVTVPMAEPWDLVMDIAATLEVRGWHWEPCIESGPIKPLAPDPRPSSCTTIVGHIQINAPAGLEGAASALAAAIKKPDVIGWDDVRVVPNSAPVLTIITGTKR